MGSCFSKRGVLGSGRSRLSRFHRGRYTSTKTGKSERYDSGWELRRMRALDASPLVKTWTRSRSRIRYRLGKKHLYLPDLFVVYHDGRVFLEEIKGRIFDPAKHRKKVLMAEAWCRARGWSYRIIFEDGLDTVS